MGGRKDEWCLLDGPGCWDAPITISSSHPKEIGVQANGELARWSRLEWQSWQSLAGTEGPWLAWLKVGFRLGGVLRFP